MSSWVVAVQMGIELRKEQSGRPQEGTDLSGVTGWDSASCTQECRVNVNPQEPADCPKVRALDFIDLGKFCLMRMDYE